MFKHNWNNCEECDLVERVANSVLSNEQYFELIEVCVNSIDYKKIKDENKIIKMEELLKCLKI